MEADDGTWIDADHEIDGGPSVVFDAVALVVSDAGAALLTNKPPARDFIADAFAHLKFVGYVEAAKPLLQKAGVLDSLDKGFLPLGDPADAAAFVAACGDLRLWEREPSITPV